MINKFILKSPNEAKNDNNNNNNKDNQIINDQKENNSSFENISGEEEDEDDLLKSDSISNNSCKSIRGFNIQNDRIIITKDNNEPFPIELMTLHVEKKNQSKEENNTETTENNNNNIDSKKGKNIEKDKNKNDHDLDSKSNSEKEKKSNVDDSPKDTTFSQGEDEEGEEKEDNEENDEDDEDKDDEEEESESVSINPYIKYKNSTTSYKNIFHYLDVGDTVYEKKSNKYYINVGILSNNRYLLIPYDILNIKNQRDILREISDISRAILKSTEIEDAINLILDIINKPKFLASIKKDKNELKNEFIVLNKNDLNKFSTRRKIKIYYLNYLNKKYSFDIFININWNLHNLGDFLRKLYHFASYFLISIKNKYSELSNREKIFLPDKFDYEKDYVLLLEKENLTNTNIDLGSNNSKYNFKGEKVSHIVFSSYYNFYVESIIVSNKINYLECEVYMFKDEYYFNLERNIGIYNFKKAKEALSSSDWEKKCNYITTIRSVIKSQYKNNDDAISFEIFPKLMILHDKSYVFLITSPNLNINTFSSGSGDQGLFIVSFDDKSILNGFICKQISDLAVDNPQLYK